MEPVLQFSVVDVPKFLAGFVYELTTVNHLTEIETCYQGGHLMAFEVEQGIRDIKQGAGWDSDVQAALEFALVALQVPQALHKCESMQDDLSAIEEWASIFTNPTELAAKVTKNFALHHKGIQEDIAALKADAAADTWFTAGEDLADLLSLAIGPVKAHEPELVRAPVSNSLMEVPDFIAGLIFGLTGDSDLPEVQACVQGGEQVVADAEALLAHLKAGEIIAVVRGVSPLVSEAKAEVATCETVGSDWAEVDAWLAQFKHPGALVEEASKNYVLHHKAISADIAAEQADWASGDYFKAGVDTADAIVALVGPIEPVTQFFQ